MLYLVLKAVHVLAVVIFLGNISTGLFWHAHALRTGDPRHLAHVMRGIIVSDRLFTMPGVFVIVASGVWMAIMAGYPLLRTTWIVWPIILFSVSGLVFMLRVAPLQRQLLWLAQAGGGQADFDEPGCFDERGYRRLARAWELWGVLSLLTPLAALFVMTMKFA